MAEHDFRDYFQKVVEDGREKVACTLCGRVIVNNVGCMRMHYTKVHKSDGNDERSDSNAPPDVSDTKPPRENLIRTVDRDDVVERTVKY